VADKVPTTTPEKPLDHSVESMVYTMDLRSASVTASSRLIVFAAMLLATIQAQNSSDLSKRGLVYIGTSHPSDYELLTSGDSPMTWYYTFSTYPASGLGRLDFVPMIHGADDADQAVAAVRGMGSDISHVLVFNEPDGSKESGGSDISPEDAASTYLETIAPLRDRGIKLSVPATTGSSPGFDWLRDFNRSCFDISKNGCEFDFVAAHWYGDFPAMASWLGTLHEAYPRLPIWLTEFALPAMKENITLDFVNQSLAYLDGLDYVERYSYFGTFRKDAANSFTGENVAMLDNDGGLTDIGALYLGGSQRGFEKGMKSAALALPQPTALWVLLTAGLTTLYCVI
jgi:hypothetical protein